MCDETLPPVKEQLEREEIRDYSEPWHIPDTDPEITYAVPCTLRVDGHPFRMLMSRRYGSIFYGI